MNTLLALLAFFLGAMLLWFGSVIASGILPPPMGLLQAAVAAAIAAIIYVAAKIGQIPVMTVEVFIQFVAYGLLSNFAVSTTMAFRKRLKPPTPAKPPVGPPATA